MPQKLRRLKSKPSIVIHRPFLSHIILRSHLLILLSLYLSTYAAIHLLFYLLKPLSSTPSLVSIHRIIYLRTLPTYLSNCIFKHMLPFLSTYPLFMYLLIHLYIYLSIYLSNNCHQHTHPRIHLTVQQFTYSSINP